MIGDKMAATALAMAMLASATQAAAQTPCLTEDEASALTATIMPDLLTAASRTCASNLPSGATLRAGLPALTAKYEAEADNAWPRAKTVVGKVGGRDLEGLDPELLRPLIGPMLAPLIVGAIKPADCPRIDRAVTLLTPLPARSTATLVVLLYQLGDLGKDRKMPFTICQAQR